MLIASLIELPIAKTRMWQKHNIQLANFDMATLRVIWFPWGPAFGLPAHRNVGSIPAGNGYLAKAQVRQPGLRDHEHFLGIHISAYELRSEENCFRGMPN